METDESSSSEDEPIAGLLNPSVDPSSSESENEESITSTVKRKSSSSDESDDDDSSSSSDDDLRSVVGLCNQRRTAKRAVRVMSRKRFQKFVSDSDSSDDEAVLMKRPPVKSSRSRNVAVTTKKRKRKAASDVREPSKRKKLKDGNAKRNDHRPKKAFQAKPKPKPKPKPEKKMNISDYPTKELPLKPLLTEKDAPKWWEMPPYKGDTKWKRLDHNGICFPPPYKQHHVNILYKGKPVELNAEQEELATFYAVMLETDWVKKKAFNINFFREFRLALKNAKLEKHRHTEINNFKTLNFRPIYNWAMKKKEDEKERKKDKLYRAKLKAEKAAMDEIYGYAIVDGVREKVGNYKVEPPGLFRGRGDHPKAGMLKKRLKPSQIILNIGKGQPIPPCPIKGEQWGGVIHDSTVTYIAKWVENINQAHKMVYLHASSRFKGQADMAKYEKARVLKKHIGSIRADYSKKLLSNNTVERQLATCVWIIDILSIRVGNEKDTDEEADTVGVCSFRVEHLTKFEKDENGIFKITLDFLGKDSMRYLNTVEIPKIIFNNLRKFVKGKKKEANVFEKVDPGMVNEYLKSMMDGLSAKVFRTHNASVCLQQELAKTKNFKLAQGTTNITPDKSAIHEKKYFYDTCNKQVAILCNHKRTVNEEKFGESSAKMDEKIAKAEKLVKEYKRRLKIAQGKVPEPGKDEAKYLRHDPATIKGQLKRKEDAVQKLKMNKNLKIENKEVALGTSKINYMDPRITVAFCKRMELPIEKVFNKALLDKFPWAMAVAPDYHF